MYKITYSKKSSFAGPSFCVDLSELNLKVQIIIGGDKIKVNNDGKLKMIFY